MKNGPILADPSLMVYAEVLNDIEGVRKSYENRLRAFTSDDPECLGLTAEHPDVQVLSGTLGHFLEVEKEAIKNLEKVMRRHPLGDFVKRSTGVGNKQMARLLSRISDPYWNDLHDRPRTLAELRSYCGVGGGGYALKRGSQCNWNTDARMRLWNIAQSCVKQPPETKYRAVYDSAREKYRDAIHTEDCKRCGPAGKPALAGSPLSAGHQHARAVRMIMRAVLEDVYGEAERLHRLGNDQRRYG